MLLHEKTSFLQQLKKLARQFMSRFSNPSALQEVLQKEKVITVESTICMDKRQRLELFLMESLWNSLNTTLHPFPILEYCSETKNGIKENWGSMHIKGQLMMSDKVFKNIRTVGMYQPTRGIKLFPKQCVPYILARNLSLVCYKYQMNCSKRRFSATISWLRNTLEVSFSCRHY